MQNKPNFCPKCVNKHGFYKTKYLQTKDIEVWICKSCDYKIEQRIKNRHPLIVSVIYKLTNLLDMDDYQKKEYDEDDQYTIQVILKIKKLNDVKELIKYKKELKDELMHFYKNHSQKIIIEHIINILDELLVDYESSTTEKKLSDTKIDVAKQKQRNNVSVNYYKI